MIVVACIRCQAWFTGVSADLQRFTCGGAPIHLCPTCDGPTFLKSISAETFELAKAGRQYDVAAALIHRIGLGWLRPLPSWPPAWPGLRNPP